METDTNMTQPSPTTLSALRTDTGERLAIGDAPTESLRVLSDGGRLRCPACGGALVLKAGKIRAHHFAHQNLAECSYRDSEPETDAHRTGKLMLYRHFRQGADMAAVELHFPATNQRADAAVRHGERTYALEFQQANNSADKWAERHALYAGQNVADIWFLGVNRYTESAAEPPRPISVYHPAHLPRDVYGASAGTFRIREMERAMLEVFPRLYYLDPNSGLLTLLLPRQKMNSLLRAFRYQLPLTACRLHEGRLWTPLDELIR